MKPHLYSLLFFTIALFVSCDDDGPYEDYLVARPLTVDITEFKANAVEVTDPVPVVNSGKIYAYKDYIFVNDVNQGFHVIDNQNPISPKSIAFIKLEGNYDISIKDDKLFADSYGDLVIFDIADINNITVANRLDKCHLRKLDLCSSRFRVSSSGYLRI